MQNSGISLKVTELIHTPSTSSPRETVRRYSHSFSQNTKGPVLLDVLA